MVRNDAVNREALQEIYESTNISWILQELSRLSRKDANRMAARNDPAAMLVFVVEADELEALSNRMDNGILDSSQFTDDAEPESEDVHFHPDTERCCFCSREDHECLDCPDRD